MLWPFINPNVIFNGDRIAFIREFRMNEKKTKNLPKDPLLPFSGDDANGDQAKENDV